MDRPSGGLLICHDGWPRRLRLGLGLRAPGVNKLDDPDWIEQSISNHNASSVPTMRSGDQHLLQNDRSGQPNPYTPTLHTLSRTSAQEIATLQAKLGRQLGPEYISERPGAAGVRVHYLEAWKCINLANEIFGFNGWSSSIQNISVDYVFSPSPQHPWVTLDGRE